IAVAPVSTNVVYTVIPFSTASKNFLSPLSNAIMKDSSPSISMLKSSAMGSPSFRCPSLAVLHNAGKILYILNLGNLTNNQSAEWIQPMNAIPFTDHHIRRDPQLKSGNRFIAGTCKDVFSRILHPGTGFSFHREFTPVAII